MKTQLTVHDFLHLFGMRKHPIDGFNKMHRGTDFAAPMGTPIMASGDGVIKKQDGVVVVEIVSKLNIIQLIKLFMHMSKFARGIKPGKS